MPSKHLNKILQQQQNKTKNIMKSQHCYLHTFNTSKGFIPFAVYHITQYYEEEEKNVNI